MQISNGVLDAIREDTEIRKIIGESLITGKGTIKNFDNQIFFCTQKPANEMQDIVLHITCLRAGGYDTANVVDRVECEVLRRPHGLQAYKILKLQPPY